MTEPADQPLLEEQPGDTKKAVKRRVTKPRTTTAAAAKATTTKTTKTTKPRTKKAAASETAELDLSAPASPAMEKAAPAPAIQAAPAAREVAPIEASAPPAAPAPRTRTRAASRPPRAPDLSDTEEWRPSGPRVPAPAEEAPTATSPKDAPAAPAGEQPPAAPAGPRQYPVYIPRHVAKQIEETGQAAPLAVSASEAQKLPVAAEELQPHRQERRERPERNDRGPRGDRHDRNDRHDRHDRNDRGNRSSDDAPVEGGRSEDVREEDLGINEGIVEISGKGFGFIRDPKRSFAQHPNDVFVTPEIVRRYNLRDGQWIKGETRRGNRGAQLHRLTEVNGDDPELSRNLPSFDELTVISPLERITLETVPERFTTRIIDLMCPVGKGQRGLVVAPPRTGKTTLLQHMADAVVKNHPDVKLIILLVDERPEEVTDFKRTVPQAEIMASSNDMDVKSHTRIAQLAIERAKRLVESGKDVFILLDSITRVGRAFNNASTGGRTMSGGIDSRALEIPRKIFAAARNTEEAGSLTIIATALIETGSRMDDVIFQEFKGTGNMELVLDRKISDMRIYPAIDIFQSGTRREELIVPADDLHKIAVIRRGLAGYKPVEAIERLLFFAKKFPTNSQMLREIPG
ncbi:MAG TPA: transcription termination factor Rho [Chthoniobacteraceae bacterium]